MTELWRSNRVFSHDIARAVLHTCTRPASGENTAAIKARAHRMTCRGNDDGENDLHSRTDRQRWKGIQAIGCVSMVAGLGLVITGTTIIRAGSGRGMSTIALSTQSVIGILILLVGFGVQALGRLGAWWFHG